MWPPGASARPPRGRSRAWGGPASGASPFLHPPAPAGRLAGPVAGAPEDAGEDVGHPVDHVGVAVAALRDQADVFGDGGVRRTGPLAIDDLVEIAGAGGIGGLQADLLGNVGHGSLAGRSLGSRSRARGARSVQRQHKACGPCPCRGEHACPVDRGAIDSDHRRQVQTRAPTRFASC